MREELDKMKGPLRLSTEKSNAPTSCSLRVAANSVHSPQKPAHCRGKTRASSLTEKRGRKEAKGPNVKE